MRPPRSSSTPTAGRRSAAVSSSIRRDRANITPISATRSSPGWTSATAPCRHPSTAGSPGSPPAATGRWSRRCSARMSSAASPRTPATRSSRRAICPRCRRRRELYVTSTTAPTSASGRTSARGRPSRRTPTTCSSTSGAWRPATRPTRTGRSGCRSTPRRRSSSPRSGSAGSPGIRCGWSRSTRTHSGRSRRSTSTPARRTSGSSTSAPRHSVARSRRIGVTDVYFELFDATHMAIEYRYPLGIRYLAERLSP